MLLFHETILIKTFDKDERWGNQYASAPTREEDENVIEKIRRAIREALPVRTKT